MPKFKRLIFEGVTSPVLFHLTSVKNAANVLKNDEFVLSQAYFGGRDTDFQKGEDYYLSTSRTQYSGFAQKKSSAAIAMINLDGKEIGNRFQTVNANFFDSGGRDESEERIIHNDPVIKNATKYINEIHVFLKPNKLASKQREYIQFLWDFAQEKTVPLYFYDEKDYWITQRKEYAKTVDDFETEEFPMFIYPKDHKPSDQVKDFLEGKLDKKIKSMGEMELYGFLQDIEMNIENSFKEPRYNDLKRKLSNRLDNYNANTIEDLIYKIKNNA